MHCCLWISLCFTLNEERSSILALGPSLELPCCGVSLPGKGQRVRTCWAAVGFLVLCYLSLAGRGRHPKAGLGSAPWSLCDTPVLTPPFSPHSVVSIQTVAVSAERPLSRASASESDLCQLIFPRLPARGMNMKYGRVIKMDLIKCLEEMCREIICVKSLCLLP